MSRLGAEPIFDSYAAVLAIGAGLLLLLLVRPQFGPLSMARQLTFLGLRLGVIALVLVALMRPTWITTMREPRTSAVVVLFDTSRSMQLPSGRESLSRWQAQAAVLGQSQAALAALANRKELRLYSYDSKLTPVAAPGGQFVLPESPKGEQTDIGTALAESLRPEQGQRVAALVIMGDGSQTAFDPLVETHEAARKLRDDFAAPLYAVTFGPAGDAAQSRDVAVQRLDEQFTVFVKNELLVRAVLRVRGYVKQDLPVSLALENEQGQHEPIGSRTVRSDEDGRQIEVEFSYTPQKPGRYRLIVAAEPQPGELVVKNNRLDAYLTVLEGGLRVLYLDGEKRFEQKFLRQALNASPDIELDDRIIDRRALSRGVTGGAAIDLAADLAAGKYDAFILGDLDAKALGPDNIKALADAVAKGKGLLMIGGRASFGRGHYLGTPLGDALPIVIDPLEGAEFRDEPEEFFLKGPITMSPGDPHSITRLTSGAGNVALWRSLPPLNWANKFAGVKQAPGVGVLLEGPPPEKRPLLVSGEFSRGRTLAFAGESTWLWPLAGLEKEHRRFWRQVILWLVRRDDLNRDDVWIRLEQRRFNPGSRVQIAAGARTAAGDPIAGVKLDTVLVRPGGIGTEGKREPVKLALDKDQWKGSLTVETPGDYLLETTATTAGGQKLGTARAEFLVFDRDVEFSNPAADPDLMASLAAWTKDEGGRAVPPEELSKLLQELADRPPEYEERETRWKLAGTATDAWVFFAGLVALLSVEWWLRKRWGLV
ncbi:MAG: glutamine amidotransferase [Planctomycetaceae bacterium]|nr:glutamine amidotransferase [Planctomycetaceae bacterium]